MEETFIAIAVIILLIWLMLHIMSAPVFKLGKYGKRKYGYGTWLLMLVSIFISMEIILLMIYLILKHL